LSEFAEYIVPGLTLLSGGIAIGFGAIGSGIGEGLTAGNALDGISRQPKEQGTLLRSMLIGQAVAETGGVFALLIAIFILWVIPIVTITAAMAALGAAMAIGFASFGGGAGSGLVSAHAVQAIERQPECSARMTPYMLIFQALSQSTLMYALAIALILLFNPGEADTLARGAALISAGFCVGLSALGPGLGIGYTGAKACESIGMNLEASPSIFRTALVGVAVTESTSIYGLVIAILLIFVAS